MLWGNGHSPAPLMEMQIGTRLIYAGRLSNTIQNCKGIYPLIQQFYLSTLCTIIFITAIFEVAAHYKQSKIQQWRVG